MKRFLIFTEIISIGLSIFMLVDMSKYDYDEGTKTFITLYCYYTIFNGLLKVFFINSNNILKVFYYGTIVIYITLYGILGNFMETGIIKCGESSLIMMLLINFMFIQIIYNYWYSIKLNNVNT